jgi:hypothetical protein
VVMSEVEATLEQSKEIINEADHEKPRWYAPELKTGLREEGKKNFKKKKKKMEKEKKNISFFRFIFFFFFCFPLLAGTLTPSSDVYSLGLITWALYNRTVPFDNLGSSQKKKKIIIYIGIKMILIV